MLEVNVLAATLHDQRLGALEASALLRTVMVEIDVAVFTFDGAQRLRLVNRAGERLLAQPAERLLGRTRRANSASAAASRARRRASRTSTFPGGVRPMGGAAHDLRQDGRPHQLLVLADVSRPLRDEERQAWQRLIRVIGHEINNSLAPIKSIAGSLESMLAREPMPDDWYGGHAARSRGHRRAIRLAQPLHDGLRAAREAAGAAAATRQRSALVRRVAGSRRACRMPSSRRRTLTIRADPDQLEQLLINLVRNAVDAALETGGGVEVGWRRDGAQLRDVDRRRRARAAKRVEPVRAVLHDEAGRIGHRPRAEPPDRRSTRRHADAGESPGSPRLSRLSASARVKTEKGDGSRYRARSAIRPGRNDDHTVETEKGDGSRYRAQRHTAETEKGTGAVIARSAIPLEPKKGTGVVIARAAPDGPGAMTTIR